MPYPSPKIATCCYCGSRTALVLRGKERHELSCATCGAPLHEMKMLRADATGGREPVRTTDHRPSSPKAGKHGRSLSQRFMAGLKDAAEEVFDIFD